MATSFKNTKGAAIKGAESYKYADGEQTLRIFGDILPRYLYWVKGTNNKDIPLECLAFDRDKEKFTNKQIDHVPSHFPDIKCSWAYAVNCLDPKDGKTKVLQLKKKLFAQILDAAETLGDPTDLDEGWDICFKKVKTGPLSFNVEYTLNTFKCKKRPLNEEEKAAVAAAENIEVKIPRPSSDEILSLINRIKNGSDEEAPASTAEQEAINELAQ